MTSEVSRERNLIDILGDALKIVALAVTGTSKGIPVFVINNDHLVIPDGTLKKVDLLKGTAQVEAPNLPGKSVTSTFNIADLI